MAIVIGISVAMLFGRFRTPQGATSLERPDNVLAADAARFDTVPTDT